MPNFFTLVAPVQRLIRESPILRSFIVGYFSCLVLGWLILELPVCQKSLVSGLDTLFTAASALSTTGLATVDIGKTFSFLGQLILLLLMQLGGIGYLILSSFVILHLEQKMLEFRRRNDVSLSSLSRGLTIASLLKQLAVYTVICELGGIIALYFFFGNEGMGNPLWQAIFHAVSAFCGAGLSLFPAGFENYENHLGINASVSILSLLGAFGFLLWVDLFKKIKLLRVLSRIVGSLVAGTIVIAAILFLCTTTFASESSGLERLTISFFHVVAAITATGFNTVNIGALSQVAHVTLIILMLVGGALTGSGINTRGTSFRGMLKLLLHLILAKESSGPWEKRTLLKRAQIAISACWHYLIVLSIFSLLLILIEEHSFISLLFETASALCTAGLSMGITPELSALGKSLIIFLMLLGKVGILIFGFATSVRELSWKGEERSPAVEPIL